MPLTRRGGAGGTHLSSRVLDDPLDCVVVGARDGPEPDLHPGKELCAALGGSVCATQVDDVPGGVPAPIAHPLRRDDIQSCVHGERD